MWFVAAERIFSYNFAYLLSFFQIQVEIIRQDVACLCLIFAVILGGFSSSFLILGDERGFGGALSHLWSCSAVVFGETNLLTFEGSEHSQEDPFNGFKTGMSLLLAFTFLFMIGIILLNRLSAKMGDTYAKVADTATESWLMEKARIIESMEREMEHKARKAMNDTLWISYGIDTEERYLQFEVTDTEFWTTANKKQRKEEHLASTKATARGCTPRAWFCVPLL